MIISGPTLRTGSGSYRFDSREQIRQDSFLAGNSIWKRLKPAHNNITTNTAPDRYAPGSRLQDVFPAVASMILAQPEGMITKR